MPRLPANAPRLPWLGLMCLAACSGQVGRTGPSGPGGTDERSPTGAAGERADLDPGEQAQDGTVAPVEAAFEPLSPLVRRLTRDEYVYTLQDVLGVSLAPGDVARLPVDRPLSGFVNTASGQTVLPDHVRAYAALSERAVQLLDFGAFLDAHASCREASEACAEGFVDSAGALLFRRPLDGRERGDFRSLLLDVVTDGGSFAEGARAVVRALLQSPQFLYRLEAERHAGAGALVAVRGYAMASRLSYLLWLSAPDAALYAAAERGELDTREGVAAQLDRMLADPRVERSTARFLLDWARLESLPDDDGLREERERAAVAFFQDFIWREGGAIADLLTGGQTFLTPALAEAYGLSPQGDGIAAYDLTAEGRRGLLAQPGVIAGMTNADGGEIVARGLFMLSQLYCGAVPDPPASLQDSIDQFVAELPEDASHREVAERRLERPECASCHAGFDPLGYAFEPFDARGAYRERDAHGNPLRSDGHVPASLADDGQALAYADVEGLMAALADSPRVQTCLTRKFIEYALGAQLESRHLASLDAITGDYTAAGGTYPDLLENLVVHDLFRTQPNP